MPDEKQAIEDIYGEFLFSVVYRNTFEDHTLCMKASRRRMSVLEKVGLIWFPWLAGAFGLFVLISNPPLQLTSAGWQIRSFYDLVFPLLMIALWAKSFLPRHLSKMQWKKAVGDNYLVRLIAYKNAFAIFKETPEDASLSLDELKKRQFSISWWSDLKGIEINSERIYLFAPNNFVFLVSNRDFNGTLSYEETCKQLRSILESPKLDAPPIAAPR